MNIIQGVPGEEGPSRFAGIIYPDVFQKSDLIPPMLDTLKMGLIGVRDIVSHRNVQFGSVGAKISFNEKKTLFCALDGIIVNHAELEKEVLKHGGRPSFHDSRKLIISAYEIWKEKCLERIDGEFAFALYDTKHDTLVLARDRMGKKPLYWYHDKHHLIFASELKALLATGIVPQTPALDAIAMYLYFGFIPQDLSPIKDVSKLLPASYLLYQPHKGRSIYPYWSYSHYFEKGQSDKDVSEKISSLLEKSTKRLLPPPNTPLGCFVTGGIGSATVAWEVDKFHENTKGFNIGFAGQNQDDVDVAAEVAKTLDMPLKTHLITPKTLTDDLVSLIWSLDEPIADPTIVATWKMSQMASSETKTVFSGMGSDEFLAGHNRYTIQEQEIGVISRLNLMPGPIIRKMFVPLIHLFSRGAALNILKVSRTNPWQFEFLRHNAILDEHRLKEAAPKLSRLFDPDTFLHKFHHMSRIGSSVSQLLYIDVKTRLPDHFMLQYDRLTKAHGLSWRAPFIDRELIEYAAGLPEPEALQEAATASFLKPMISSVFSQNIVGRPKKSRRSFLNSWMEYPEIHSLFQYLLKGTLVESGFISEGWLREQIFSPHPAQDSFRVLWAILVLEIWFHLFINSPIRAVPATKNLHELLTTP